ncbi:hypothetical protein ACH5BF_03300 [Arcobacter sp. YIC-464]|uniref:hypothetical protein n=1 Tax=Arcobacter sp. YIC-464 TaxID=3376631 RepID=UPI003C2883BB
MKKLVSTVLLSSVMAGSLFANDTHMMNKDECIKMHKEFHKNKSIQPSKITISKDVLDALYPEEDLD